uniref:Pre-mRNA-processing factor 6 n=1 Tax=Aceria tosichella TaxID=561515 RepID=A0A6G1S430_9ACAR
MSPPPGRVFVPPNRDFLNKPAPPGYVAGIGRGATGFTTRSDIGPAREAAAFVRPDDDPAAAAGPSSSGGVAAKPKSGGANKRNHNDDDEEEEDLNESNYDEFAGYGGSLFSRRDPYEEDDEEADRIYAGVDKHIDERGKALREKRARQELELYRQKRPKIQQQFTDLKANLKQVSVDEWANIPDVGDARNRKQRVIRQDKFTPVPDSLLAHQAKLATGGERLVYIDPTILDHSEDDEDDDDDDDRDGASDKNNKHDATTSMRRPIQPLDDRQGLNIGEMSEFRSTYMSMKLSGATSNTNTNSTTGDNNNLTNTATTNPQAYLTNLSSMIPNQITDTATVQEYRKQFAALRASNSTFPNGWIASVRLEEAAGKLKAARSLVLAACEHIPKSPDLWLEAIRLHPPDIGKALMVKALKEIPRSEKLWTNAAELESNDESKRRVYAKAREIIPKSSLIWKKSVELESPESARVLLRQAVECCPDSVDLWLALAKLSPYEEANQVLKEANEKNPLERSIWITAAKLQETVGKLDLIEKIIKLSVSDLAERGVEINRNDWLKEAMDADRANFKCTCREIIRRIIGWNIQEQERLQTWLDDAKSFIVSGSINCARAVYLTIVEDKSYSRMESVWLEYANFELKHAAAHHQESQVVEVLRRAVEPLNCGKSEALWLMLANQLRADPIECRRILAQAHEANPNSEKIVLAAVELEMENNNSKIARRILADACMSAKTAQLVMRSAKLEWSLGNLDEAVRMLKAGVQEYKNHAEFYLSLGQIEEQRGDLMKAKEWVSSGLKFNPTSVELWINMAHLEERSGAPARARSKLEMARLRNPRNVQLWLEAAQLEWRQYMSRTKSGATKGAQRGRPDIVITILAKGIKECRDQPDVEKLTRMQAEIQANK